MAENENMVVNQVPPEEQSVQNESLGKRIWAGIKEWVRKQIVTLKRAPHRIPLLMIVITSVLWLFWLFTFSKAVYGALGANWTGLLIFGNTMLSILVLPLFLNAFPKRSKPKVIFIVLVFIFLAAMIVLDVVYYDIFTVFAYGDPANGIPPQMNEAGLAGEPAIEQSFSLSIAHMVLVGVCIVILALLPVYTVLIRKINTSKNIEGNDINETIDVEEK